MSADNSNERSAQIVTLTLSPALDLATTVDVVAPTHKLRCRTPRFDPGGGGINVARVARLLGATVMTVAPLGGGNGDEVERFLVDEGVPLRRIDVAAPTRQSFSVFEESTGDQYRFVVPGHGLTAEEIHRCVDAVVEEGRAARCVVISGSLPEGTVPDFMMTIASGVAPTPVVIDVSGVALAQALASGARVVKPSANELSTVVGRALVTERDILEAATDVLNNSTVEALVVSIGPGGAFLLERNRPPVRFRAPTVRVVSAVGAGDSMVAGIAVAISEDHDLIEATRRGIAAGTATVLTEGTRLCRSEDIAHLLPMVTVDDVLD
jgi:6-phosphofructokinase 2